MVANQNLKTRIAAMLIIVTAAFPSLVMAETVKAVPGCQAVMGDVYDSDKVEYARTLDGAGITSLQQLVTAAETPGAVAIQGGKFTGWTFGGLDLSGLCFFESDLRETDWYGIAEMHGGKPVFLPAFRYYDGEIEIYRGGKTRYTEMPDKLINFMTCGARASFPDMVLVKLPESEMARYRSIADHW